MSSLKFKRIKQHHSSSKNKLNMIKNMTGMNDPAFQSNKTLKQYINQKLNYYIETQLNIIPKTKSITKSNDKSNYKKNNKKLLYNLSLPYSSKINNISNNDFKIIPSSNSFKKKNNNSINRKNYSFINNKNKSLNKKKNKISEYSIYLNVNDNSNINSYNIINNTPINIKIKGAKTTPINELNKKKSIYNSKPIYLNSSLGFENIRKKSFNNNKNKLKEKCDVIINQKKNQKIYKNKNPISVEKKAYNQIKLLKEELNNIISNKTLNNNILQLNKSCFREETKISYLNNAKLINRKINYSMHNKIVNKEKLDINSENKISLLKNKISNLVKQDDESFMENECPIPMPYVKRYSESVIEDNKYDENNDKDKENIKFENIIFNKDLKEPKEEKKIPLPISQSLNQDLIPIKNTIKDKKCFIYSNAKKLNNWNKKKL